MQSLHENKPEDQPSKLIMARMHRSETLRFSNDFGHANNLDTISREPNPSSGCCARSPGVICKSSEAHACMHSVTHSPTHRTQCNDWPCCRRRHQSAI